MAGYPVEDQVLRDAFVGIANPSYAHVRTIQPALPVVVEQTSALTIGGGSANDTYLLGIVILANAVAVTVAVTGMADEDGDAKTITFTGSTTVDTVIRFGSGLLNTKAAWTVTASVADKAIINYWPAA